MQACGFCDQNDKNIKLTKSVLPQMSTHLGFSLTNNNNKSPDWRLILDFMPLLAKHNKRLRHQLSLPIIKNT